MKAKAHEITVILGWFLLVLLLLWLGMVATFEEGTVSTGAAIALCIVFCILIARRVAPILASLINGEE